MNHYETVFIMNPVLSEDQVKETVKRYTAYLKKNKAEIVSEENWGLKKLRYPIAKKKSGFYCLIEYKANGVILSEMDVEFKRDETVLRWITVKLDKFATEYAVRRRTRLNEPKKSDE
ncbi:MAG: 30S ribosomal protein S6 [Flavobacteriales bacterium]